MKKWNTVYPQIWGVPIWKPLIETSIWKPKTWTFPIKLYVNRFVGKFSVDKNGLETFRKLTISKIFSVPY